MHSLLNSHEGEECFILGNGKSLADESELYLDSFSTLGSNRVYLKYTPDFYACVNPLVAGQYKEEIEKLKCYKFVTELVPMAGAYPLHSRHIVGFSTVPLKFVCEGWTVTYVLMQIAYWLGFKTVYLLGVDHYYIHNGAPNEQLVATGEDPNHFDPHYFSDGKLWNAPDLARSEQSYRIAKKIFEADGRKIYNATPGSRLDVFEKVSL